MGVAIAKSYKMAPSAIKATLRTEKVLIIKEIFSSSLLYIGTPFTYGALQKWMIVYSCTKLNGSQKMANIGVRKMKIGE